jgi:ankyrin repeat protein
MFAWDLCMRTIWARCRTVSIGSRDVNLDLELLQTRDQSPIASGAQMTSDEEVIAVVQAVKRGDIGELKRLLAENPALASSRLAGIAKGRTPLHVVTDWPGYFPNGPLVARTLIDAGADLNGRGDDPERGETPLHWAASSDDSDVATVLIDAGADLETPNGSIGTPLDNAVGYECWNVARLLVARGAPVNRLWHAAALGMLDRLEELLSTDLEGTPEKNSQAFWHACAGGQCRAAELLVDCGADFNWQPDYSQGSPLDAAKRHGTRRSNVIEWLTSRGAHSAEATD